MEKSKVQILKSDLSDLALFLILLLTGLVLLASAMPESIDTRNVKGSWFFLRSPPIGGQEVTMEQAQRLVSFKIGLPASLGEPVQVKFDDQSVVIIWMETKPSQESTLADVRSQGGIILFEWLNTMTPQESANHIEALTNSTKDDEGALQKVSINGCLGCAGGNIAHDVTWCTKTVLYELQANLEFPLEQLIEIARSIPQTNDLP